MATTTASNGGKVGVDTTLTKVFVGGLAWETPMEALRDFFLGFGDISEAVIISDKLTGRSKGYGFVTFQDPEAAKKACEDSSPIINGRRANCNLAALGARRSKTPPPAPQPHPAPVHNLNGRLAMGGKTGLALVASPPPPPPQVQWYYQYPTSAPATAFPFQYHQQLPYYGYSPAAYIPADYNHKIGYNGGAAYYPHHQMYAGGLGTQTNTMMQPNYSNYHHQVYHQYYGQQHHQLQTAALGFPAQPTFTAVIAKVAPPLT